MTFSSDFYNEAWYKWDDMKVYGPTARHTRRFIFALMKRITFKSVLDAGCGTGVLLQQILNKYPDSQLIGSEYSPQGLEFAKKRLPQGEFHVLDLSKEHLEKQFDLITCIDVLEHIQDDRAALKNLLAMTKGHMILSVPIGPLFKAEVDRMGHVHGYGRAELEQKIQQAGFEIVQVIQWGFPFYNLHRRLANRMPAETSTGSFNTRKKLIANLLYGLFFLNLPFGGERYYVLCRPAGQAP
jgi:2-polyprenyl-3-methyl-5-hydroxy-6-metoxy-1,4-benzoquinol methylase